MSHHISPRRKYRITKFALKIYINISNQIFWCKNSRVAHTQPILFLKSMSERGGSDMERLKIWIFNRFWVDLEIHHSISESLYVGSVSFRHWFKIKMAWVWTTLKTETFSAFPLKTLNRPTFSVGFATLCVTYFMNFFNGKKIFLSWMKWISENRLPIRPNE